MRWRRSRSTDLDDGAGTGAVDGGAEPTAMGLRRRRAGASPRTLSVLTTRRAGDGAGCCFGVRDGPEDVSRKSRTSRFVRSILGTGFDEGGCGGRAVSTTGGARAAARRPRRRARRASRSSRSDTTESSAESSSALGWWGRSHFCCRMGQGHSLHQPSKRDGELVPHRQNFKLSDLPLLPYERQLIEFLEISEAEYRQYRADLINSGKPRPAEYAHIPEVRGDVTTILINLAIGLLLTGVSMLLAPKPKAPKRDEREQNIQCRRH